MSPQAFISGRRRVVAAALTLAAGLSWGAVSPAAMEELERKVAEETLPNGMRVLILPRHHSPTISLYIRFIVGSTQEEAGRSGLAHLLEHMMFKGTRTLGTRDFTREKPLLAKIERLSAALDREKKRAKRADPTRLEDFRGKLRAAQDEARRFVVKDEIDSLYTSHGAVGFNASTGVDLTTYTVSLPSNRLPLWARIESERLRDPVMREFYSERDVVREERRQSYETNPHRKMMALLLATAFLAHPYRRPIIGWAGDVEYLRAPEAEDFFRTYYSPNNTVLAAVGDVRPEEFLPLVRTAFGSLPPQELPPDRATPEPEQEGERRVSLLMDSSPEIVIGYHKPSIPDFDDYVFDLLDGVLSRGRTSRLYHSLVEEKQLAVAVTTVNGIPGSRYPNLFVILATPRSPHSATEVETEILSQLQRLTTELISEKEIRKIKNQLRADMMRRLQSNAGLADMLSYFQAVAGDWRYITTHLDVLEEITPEDLREVAGKYFRERNRTVVTLVSMGDSGGP
jgi:predicted Zn-dependent peptidase